MKLATYKDGSRDGQLLVVSRDLNSAHFATGIATRLQQALDDWNFIAPQLQDLYVTLNQGKARHAFAFEPRQCMAPLPRAYQWASGAAWLSHPERLLRARGQGLPENALTAPCLVQGASDDFLGPCDDAWFGSAAWGIDLEPGLAVVLGDVAMGASPEQALDGVRLLLLANRWRLRALDGPAAGGAAPSPHSLPAAAFGPVAVTPDELGDAWQRGRLQGTLQVQRNGQRLGRLDSAAHMHLPFGELVAHLGKTRHLRAGSIVGAGPVSVPDATDGAPPSGFASLAEQQAQTQIATGGAPGQPSAPLLALGDTVEIDFSAPDGETVFGRIAQRVVGPGMDVPGAAPAEALGEG